MIPTPSPAPPPPTSGPPPAAESTPPGRGNAAGGRVVVGIVVMVVALIAGVLLWVSATSRYDEAVRSLARAPVGCDTTLDFSDQGDYLIFVETRGEIPVVRGDCELQGRFDLATDTPPSVDVRIVDPDGQELTVLSRRGRETYDRAGSTGTSWGRVVIEQPGDHVVRVETTSNTAFAVAIGRDPADGVAALRLAAIAVALLGGVVGLIVALTARRRPPPPAPTSGWAPQQPVPGAWTAPPPSGPPPMQAPSGPPSAPAWQPLPPQPPAPSWQPSPPADSAPQPAWQPSPPAGSAPQPSWQPSPPGAAPPPTRTPDQPAPPTEAWQPAPPEEPTPDDTTPTDDGPSLPPRASQ